MFNKFSSAFALTAGLVAGAGAAMAADSAPAPRAVVVAPGPQASGDVYGSLGVVARSGIPTGIMLLEFNGGGRGNVPLGMRAWNFEGQVSASSGHQIGGGGAGSYSLDLGATAHLWNRMPMAALGGLVSWNTGLTYQGTFTSVGGEFKVFAPRASFGAAAAVSFFDYIGLAHETTWTLNAAGNFYLNPNLGFGLHGAFTRVSLFGVDAWEVGGSGEMRLPGAPATLFLDVTRTSGLKDVWRSRLGARFQIDAPKSTLQSHDRDVPFDFVVPRLTF